MEIVAWLVEIGIESERSSSLDCRVVELFFVAVLVSIAVLVVAVGTAVEVVAVLRDLLCIWPGMDKTR